MKYLKSAVSWAREVGELQKQKLGTEIKIDNKSAAVDLVTEVDEKSERIIKNRIRREYPTHSIRAEEGGREDRGSSYQWIIDPIDGTNNYASGFPIFAVSIALKKGEEIVAGVVYAPKLGELYTAIKGEGAFLNGEAIFVSETNSLQEAILATGFPYDKATSKENNITNFTNLVPHTRGIRRTGSAAFDLCNVAAGRFDGFWELKLKPWDIAAGGLIVKEAGGVMMDFTGDEISSNGDYVIAGNQKICNLIRNSLNY